MVEALEFAQKNIQPIIEEQEKLTKKIGKEKSEVELFNPHPELKSTIANIVGDRLAKAYTIADKTERENVKSRETL